MIDKIKSFPLVRALINIKNGLPYPEGYSKLRICIEYFFFAVFGGFHPDEYFYWFKLYARKDKLEFISNSAAHKIEAKLNGVKRIECFRSKQEFNKLFHSLIRRNWLYVPEATLEEFQDFCKLGTANMT